MRERPYKIALKLTNTNFKVWTKEVIIRENIEHWDFGYPSISSDDTHLHISFYWQDDHKTRYIEYTKIKISELEGK